MSEGVTVVGAGPSGLAAAITLARAGVPVRVYEKGPAVGTRFHGDFQGLENWSREEDVLEDLGAMGLEINFPARPRTSADFYDADGELHRVSMERPFFYLVRRGDVEGSLDRGLYAQAREAGVRFRFNTKLDHVEGPAIIATGPRYGDAIVVGYLFETDLEETTIGMVSQAVAPGGYSYLLVDRGRATLASCQFAQLSRWRIHLEGTVAALRRIRPFEMRKARFFSGYGNLFLRRRLQEGQKLYVGEAAGLQDALWGFGMRYALTSGHLAAHSLLAGERYEPLVQRELSPRQRADLVNRACWELLGDWGFALFVEKAARRANAWSFVHRGTGPHWSKGLLYPLVRRMLHWRGRYRDEGCRNEECTCVWCTCSREIQSRSQIEQRGGGGCTAPPCSS